MNIVERIRLWVNINYYPLLYDMVVTKDGEEILIRLEAPSFRNKPIARGQV